MRKVSIYILFFLFFYIHLSTVILGEELSSLEINFLGEKTKILTVSKIKDSEIYIPLPLFASTFKYDFSQENSKVILYQNKKEIFNANIGDKKCVINKKEAILLYPVIREDVVYFPLSSFFRLLGYRVYLKENSIFIVHEVSEIKYSKNLLSIGFKAKSPVEIKSLVLQNPSRLVIDLLNTVYINNKGEIITNDANVKNIRFSQFNVAPYIVRVVIEFKDKIPNYDIKQNDGIIYVSFSGNNIKEEKSQKENPNIQSVLTGLKWKEEKETVDFFLTFLGTYTFQEKKMLYDPPRVYYDFIDATFSLTSQEFSINVYPVKILRIGLRDEDKKIMRLVFETYTDSVQTVEEIGQNELKISFKKEKSSSEENKLENNNYTIFIDPGHGGSDPGAIYGDIKEKDINLKVSLKLAEKLKQKGYNVILTRSDDSNISLDDRVKIVNTSINLNNNLATSSLLISIHSNAAFSTDVRGIEICYANDLSEGLVNILFSVFNSGDFLIRRSIKGKFYVLSRVSIPSVIIEMGFLTNDEDRKLLLNDEYQDKLIEKIIEAIELYRKGEVKNE